jgi:hypothetical protein
MVHNPAMPETAERGHRPAKGFVPEDVHRRRRLVAVVAGVVLVAIVVVVIVVLNSGGGGDAPSDEAANLVPSDALVFVNVSTDPDSASVKNALKVGNRLPSFASIRTQVLRRLGTRKGPVNFERQIRPWLGNEAALAVLPSAGSVSNSEIVLDVRDRAQAERFITESAGTGGSTTYRGIKIVRYGAVATAFVSGDLVIAPEAVLRVAIDRSQGRGHSLDENPLWDKARANLPSDRALDIYLSRDGVERLLAPQSGILGLTGTLLSQPALAAVGVAMGGSDDQAKLTFDTVLDPALAKASPRSSKPFEPDLLNDVPKDAVAYLGVTGLDRAAARLLGLAGATGVNGAGLAALARQARARLGKESGVDLNRDVLSALQNETALFVLPGLPTPTLALIAKTKDEKATRVALAKLQVPLAKLLSVPANGAGSTPTFQQQDAGGVPAFQLRLGPTIELDYAVFDGKVVVATSLAGIRRIKEAKGSLEDAPAFQSVLADRPSSITSLVFLDFGQLLALSERTGLRQDPAYLAVRGDLQRIRAVGVATSAKTNETTAELTISVK